MLGLAMSRPLWTNALLGLCALSLGACKGDAAARATGSSADAPTASAPVAASGPTRSSARPAHARLLAERPYELLVPAGVEPTAPLPLGLFLHGLGASGDRLRRLVGLRAIVDAHQILAVAPDGTRDSQGRRFWHATDACCDFDRTGVSDVDYLDAVLADVMRRRPVDRRRVFAVGYSNGAFMAHRLACERSERLAAIVAFSGVGWLDPGRCRPTAPVAVLQVHGDADPIVALDGGHLLGRPDLPRHPSAPETTAGWARALGCASTKAAAVAPGPAISGKPTSRLVYPGCPRGAVELWTVQGGGHVIGMDRRSLDEALRFVLAHPKT